MKKGAKLLGLIVILLIIGSAFVGVVTAEEIIIDTEIGESGFTAYPSRPVIGWYHVKDHDTFHTKAYNDNFWYTLCGEEGHYYGLWQASLPQSGDYEVFVWIPDPDPFVEDWPPYRTYTPTQSAVYQIYHKDGLTTKTVNQELRTGGFYSLGTFNFDTLASVILNDRTGESYLSTMIAFDAVKFVPVVAPNNPPYTPSNPSPATHATGQSIHTDLGWTGGDPDAGDTVTYDVYFGTSTSPPEVSTAQSGITYDPGTLNYNTKYYWKIVATDNHGASTTGPLWDFTTGSTPNTPPYTPSTPSPATHATGQSIHTDLGWIGGDPDTGDTVTYDVYFGTSTSPPKVSTAQSGITYDPGTLNYNTKYYWKIVATDNHGAPTTGPLWDFTTGATPNTPPYTPAIPSGLSAGFTGTSYSYSTSATDPDGDQVKYTFDWDDGTTSVTGLVNSGTSASKDHSWDSGGTYYVKAMATDSHGAPSGWSGSKIVTISNTEPQYKPNLTIPVYAPYWIDAHKGTKLNYTINVTNEGTKADKIILSTPDKLDWDIQLSETSVTLAPGQSTKVYLLLTIEEYDGIKRITITGTSKGDTSKTSSCQVKAKGIGEGHGLFAATLYFRNKEDHTLALNVPDYVKISDETVTLNPSENKPVNVVFDPKPSVSGINAIYIDVTDLRSEDSTRIPIEFGEFEIIATTFDMATDSYSFPNWGPEIPIVNFELWGNCYGMSETSILYFMGMERPNNRPNTYMLTKDKPDNAKWKIMLHQWNGDAFLASLLILFADNVKEYEALEKNIRKGIPMLLNMQEFREGEIDIRHTVVAYKIIKKGDKAYIFIYENVKTYDISEGTFYEALPYATYNLTTKEHEFDYTLAGSPFTKFIVGEAERHIFEKNILVVECPVNVTVTDQYNRIISDDGTNEIPNASILPSNELKLFYLPIDLTYIVNISAYDVGNFTLTKVSPITNNTASLNVFDNITTTNETQATLEIAPNRTNPMKIDYNGDGHIDEEKSPDVNESIEMNQPPIASFTYSPPHPIVNQTITFSASASYDPDGSITNYKWNFGDGNITNTTDPIITHTYVSAGDYTVNLTVTDDDGATDQDTTTLAVTEPPIANANGPYRGVIEYIAVPITFDGTGSYDPDGTIIEYAWDLDNDGKFDDAVGATPTVSFTAPGIGIIHLKVTDNNGATDTDTTTLTITKQSPPPDGIHGGLLTPPEQPQCYSGTSTIQGKGNFTIDERIQDWATAIDTTEHMEGTGEFEMDSKTVLDQAANPLDFYDPHFYHKKTMQFQGNATNRLINRETFESSGIFGGTGTRINEYFDVSMIQKDESSSIKTISAPGSGQSHKFATMDDFSGIWGIHSDWQKICQKEIAHHQLFKGNFSVQKDLTFEREVIMP